MPATGPGYTGSSIVAPFVQTNEYEANIQTQQSNTLIYQNYTASLIPQKPAIIKGNTNITQSTKKRRLIQMYYLYLNPLEMRNYDQNFYTVNIVYNLLTTSSNDDTFLQYILVILKRTLQNYQKIFKKYFLITTCIVIYVPGSHLPSYKSVLHVAKGLKQSWVSQLSAPFGRIFAIKTS